MALSTRPFLHHCLRRYPSARGVSIGYLASVLALSPAMPICNIEGAWALRGKPAPQKKARRGTKFCNVQPSHVISPRHISGYTL
jgi:hypothetical protein